MTCLNNKIEANYSEISIDFDSNQLPVVILKETNSTSYFIKLTEYNAYEGDQLENISSKYSSGIWKKTNGKNCAHLIQYFTIFCKFQNHDVKL